MLRTLRIVLRLFVIGRTLARHDALAVVEELGLAPTLVWLVRLLPARRVDGRPGQKLTRALIALGPAFIKLGQFLSTRADLMGEQMAADLAELQDRLPPFTGDEARATIEAELGRTIDELFSHFEATPVSAASISQVHFAVTREETGADTGAGGDAPPGVTPGARPGGAGREVAVKVLRPGIERAFRRDLAVFYWLAHLAERTQPRLRRFKPVAVVREFEEIVGIEMDLAMEAAAANELAENFDGDETYHTPPIDWRRTSRRVLTMGRISGIRIDDRSALLAAGFDLTEVLTKAAAIFFNQVFRDGFFHGDQHPGNMFVDAEGNIVAVDFGIMGRLDQQTRTFLAEMLLAQLSRNYHRLAEVHVQAGYLPAGEPLEVFAQALRSVSEPIFDRPLAEISLARLLARLLQLSESFNMPVQPQLLLLQKNMMMAEGVSRSLDPTLNIWTLAEPLIEEWMRATRGPEARLRRAAEDLTGAFERLPGLVGKAEVAADAISSGKLRLHPDSVEELARQNGGRVWHIRALWIAVAALALGLVASL